LKKWYPAAAVAGHLVKANPQNPGTWINLADLVRRAENVEQAETVLLKARDWHPKNALIAFNLACYASVMGRIEEAKVRLRHAIDLDTAIVRLALDDKDLRRLFGIGSVVALPNEWPQDSSVVTARDAGRNFKLVLRLWTS
jgi:tetratricopeptide (TPR) repeat protein